MRSQDTTTQTLIIGRPGLMRDGLKTLLSTIRSISAVTVASDWAAVQNGLEYLNIDLFVVDCNGLQDDDAQLVRQVRTACPNAGCIAIVKDINREDIARSAGADEVFCQGFETEQLLGAVRRLIQPYNVISLASRSGLAQTN